MSKITANNVEHVASYVRQMIVNANTQRHVTRNAITFSGDAIMSIARRHDRTTKGIVIMTTQNKVRFVLNHRDGSRKAKTHERFDNKGPDDARKYARKAGIAETTINSWFSQFRKHAVVLSKIAKRNERKIARVAKDAVAANDAVNA